MSEHILEFFPAANGETQRLSLHQGPCLQINSAAATAPAHLQIFTGLNDDQLGSLPGNVLEADMLWVPGAILAETPNSSRQRLRAEVLKRLQAGTGIALFGSSESLAPLACQAGISSALPLLPADQELPMPEGFADLTLHTFYPVTDAATAVLLHIRVNAKRRTSQCLFNGPLQSDQIDAIWASQTRLHALNWDIYTVADACRYQPLNQHQRVPEVVKQTDPSEGAREILRLGQRSALMVASCEPMDDLVSGAEQAPHREAANFYKSWVRKVYNGKLLCTSEAGKAIKIGFSEFGWREIREAEGFGI